MTEREYFLNSMFKSLSRRQEKYVVKKSKSNVLLEEN